MFKLILQMISLGIRCKRSLRWTALNLIDAKSTLVQASVDPDLCGDRMASLDYTELNSIWFAYFVSLCQWSVPQLYVDHEYTWIIAVEIQESETINDSGPLWHRCMEYGRSMSW